MRIQKLLVAFVSLVWFTGCSENKKEFEHTGQTISVKLADASENSSNQFVYASGKTEYINSANLSTRMMGYITAVHVKVGDKVKGGQLLISVNNSELNAKKSQADVAVLQASVSFENTKKDYDRFVKLFSQQSASQKELDDITTRYEVAKAALEGAKQMSNEVKAQFAYTNIAAPFAGIVTNTFVKNGDMTTPGTPLISLEGVSGMQVNAMVSESDIRAVNEGMKVKIFVKSIDKEFDGTVTEVSPSSKNTGSQYQVKINFDNPGTNVLSGMTVKVMFQLKNTVKDNPAEQRVLVYESALVKKGQLTGIYTIGAGNVALLRWLRTGKTFNEKVEVLSGLSANEKYILSSDGKLFNGVRVKF